MGPPRRLRAVLDTNVVVSALMFESGRLAWIRHAWRQERFAALTDEACAGELLRVLAYPKFDLQPRSLQVLMGTYLPYAEPIPRTEIECPIRAPDVDDQKFLDLAVRGRATVLVTGDAALQALDGKAPFAIESPAAFRQRVARLPR